MLRFIAKNIVANGYAKKCELQVSYGIGIAVSTIIFLPVSPVSLNGPPITNLPVGLM